jgi:DNA-binding protein
MAEEEARTGNDNSIFIGGKPFMNYVTAVVDVAEVAAKRFLEGSANVKDIKIDSEEFTNKEGRNVRVSTIEITLSKK